jgi:hypothetical protein
MEMVYLKDNEIKIIITLLDNCDDTEDPGLDMVILNIKTKLIRVQEKRHLIKYKQQLKNGKN